MFLQLGGLDFEVAFQIFHIAGDEQCAMVKAAIFAYRKGVAGEFAATAKQVVTATLLNLKSIIGQSAGDNLKLAVDIINFVRYDKRKVQVAIVMIDGTAAGTTPHKKAAIGLKAFYIALAERVLVLPDNHRATVLPKIHRDGVRLGQCHKIVLNRNVLKWIGLVGNNYLQFRHNKIKIYMLKKGNSAPV